MVAVLLHHDQISRREGGHYEKCLNKQKADNQALKKTRKLPKLGHAPFRITGEFHFARRPCDWNLEVFEPVSMPAVIVHLLEVNHHHQKPGYWKKQDYNQLMIIL